MDFKKDYINYVLHTIIQNEFYGARDDVRIRKILEKIIITPDVAKATFLTGKTAGLEILFKYLLYISDKIDKSQITVFNLKDNFDYDIHNLKKICGEIKKYRSGITKPAGETEIQKNEEAVPEQSSVVESSESDKASEESITAESITEEMPEAQDVTSETGEGISEQEAETTGEEASEEETTEEETTEEEQVFTLIENRENGESDDEVFGLAGITRSIEMEEAEENVNAEDFQSEVVTETVDEELEIEEELIKESGIPKQPVEEYFEAQEDEILTESDIEKINSIKEKEEKKKEELEIEIKSPAAHEEELPEDVKEGTVTAEVYYRFENKFFEEVKILEKLFSNTGKECRGKPLEKLSEKSLQRFSEIIEISSELANLTRQLSLDLTADIFLTINLLFTKAINNPSLINPERTKLLSSSLMLVTSLIKGEDYLGYDELVKKIEALKEDIKKPAETKKEIPEEKEIEENAIKEEIPQVPVEEVTPEQHAIEPETVKQETVKQETAEQEDLELKTEELTEELLETESQYAEYPKEIFEKPALRSSEAELRNMDTVLFKMKYLVKEFEKIFTNVSNPDGEFTKFEILDEIDNLNNLLRMLAKISSSVKNADVLKLSEVSYVFLKYLKDYRMNLLDAEIQQIIKYIIFTYKMLLTDRKPEDFDILVQYLNNPVKIFTDT